MKITYSQKQKEMTGKIRNALVELLSSASSVRVSEEQLTVLKETIRMLEDTFLVVVVGEFNAGKSSFINALLNTEALAEGVTPTTVQINLIRYGETEKKSPVENWGLLLELPSSLLESMSFVDTPGTNAVISEHEILTKWFLPRADMVLFLTSADRPFSESERKFLETIRDWGKKTVIILNKIDLFTNPEDLNNVTNFVKENAVKLLGCELPVIPVSARLAKKARAEMDPEKWEESGYSGLEHFIQEKMDERSRFIIKMESALGIGTKVADEISEQMRKELDFYQEDKKLSDSIRSQVDLYQSDMNKEIDRSMKEIAAIFMEIRKRGNDYFEELFKVKNIPGMLKKDKNQLEFQESVLKNLPTEVERKTAETVEMISIQQQRMVSFIDMQIRARSTQFQGNVIPADAMNERTALLGKMQSTIDEMLEKIDASIASNIGMKHAQSAVTAGLAIEVSAIGIGAALTAITTTVAADILGIVAAFWVGVAGLLVLPYYKKKSQKEFDEKISEVEEKLSASLRQAFTDEVNEQGDKMSQAIRPFERFVESSITVSQKTLDSLNGLKEQFEQYKEEIRR